MYELKKLFVVSDVHGHMTAMKTALDKAGFDPENADHLFVSCGDLFDRGRENKAVFEYVRSLPRKVLIRGNHEDMLMNLLLNERVSDCDLGNGMLRTVEGLLGKDALKPDHTLHAEKYRNEIREICSFVDSMADYFETEQYVFTHGWLPLFEENGQPNPDRDFHYAMYHTWQGARFLPWTTAFSSGAVLKDKTIVCGHRAVQHAVMFDPYRLPEDSEPFYGNGMIAIDALTVYSGKVNVLVLEERVPVSHIHTMTLQTQMFRKIATGEKLFEIRLFDKKRQELRMGDTILFSNKENPGETISVNVLGLHRYDSFAWVVAMFDPKALGFDDGEEDVVMSLLKSIYGDADKTNGVLAIRVGNVKYNPL